MIEAAHPSRKLITLEEVWPYLIGDAWLPKRAAAGYVGMSVRKLEGLREIPRCRVGGKVYYRRSALDAFMTAHSERRAAAPVGPGGLRGLLEQSKRRALEAEKNTHIEGHKG